MKNPTMLYKFPGNQVVVGKEGYTTEVVDADSVKMALEGGWRQSPQEAKELYEQLEAEKNQEPPSPSIPSVPPSQKIPPFAQGAQGGKVSQGGKGK